MPAKKIALVFSDSHLAQGAWVSREPVKGDSYYGFQQIVDLAIHHKVPLIGAGDLIDTKRPDPMTIEVLRTGCGRLAEAELPFWYIMGQHDLTWPPWFEAISDWPRLISMDSCYDIRGVVFGGFSWASPEVVNDALREETACDVLILHQVWEEFMGGGHIVCDGSLVHVPSNVKAVFTGDYHKHMKTIVTNLEGTQFPVYSPGSTCLQSIDEPRNKSVYLLHDDLSIKSIGLRYRPTLTIEQVIASESALDEFCDTIKREVDTASHAAEHAGVPEGLREPLIYVEYSPDVSNVVTRLRKAVPSIHHLFLKAVFVESPERQARKTSRAKVIKSGLEGAVAAITVDDAELRGTCQQLLAANDPGAALQGIKDAYFKKEE